MLKYHLSVERRTEYLNGREKINMKKWTTPMAMEECFTANVDVAVTTCYKIACNTDVANAYEIQKHGWESIFYYHNSGRCGNENNQVVVVDDKNNITGMKELRQKTFGSGVDVLPCEIFEDSGYTTPGSPGTLEVGKTVYWRTNYEGKDFSHQGILKLVDANKKAMS